MDNLPGFTAESTITTDETPHRGALREQEDRSRSIEPQSTGCILFGLGVGLLTVATPLAPWAEFVGAAAEFYCEGSEHEVSRR